MLILFHIFIFIMYSIILRLLFFSVLFEHMICVYFQGNVRELLQKDGF